METLFGIPTNRLTLYLLGIFVAGALILIFLAARDRTSFRIRASVHRLHCFFRGLQAA